MVLLLAVESDETFMKFEVRRRQALVGRGALGIVAFAGFPAWATPAKHAAGGHLFPAGPTIARFCLSLMSYNESMPAQLRQQIQHLTDDVETIPYPLGIERRRAERIAMIAVRVFASRALHKAGYNDHAVSCETTTELNVAGRMAAIAQNAIGQEHRHNQLAGAAQIAYGAAAHGANAVVAATSREDRWVPGAGERAASALLSVEELGDEDDKRWMWGAAAATVASCATL